MKIKMKVLLLLFSIVVLAVIVLVIRNMPTKQENRARQIIHTYMNSNGMDLKPGTEEYKIFMRRIVWGEFPELTGEGSNFIMSIDELDYVYNYAWKYSGYKELYGDYHENFDLQEAIPPPPTNSTK